MLSGSGSVNAARTLAASPAKSGATGRLVEAYELPSGPLSGSSVGCLRRNCSPNFGFRQGRGRLVPG